MLTRRSQSVSRPGRRLANRPSHMNRHPRFRTEPGSVRNLVRGQVKQEAHSAATHGLRHTFATVATEAAVLPDRTAALTNDRAPVGQLLTPPRR